MKLIKSFNFNSLSKWGRKYRPTERRHPKALDPGSYINFLATIIAKQLSRYGYNRLLRFEFFRCCVDVLQSWFSRSTISIAVFCLQNLKCLFDIFADQVFTFLGIFVCGPLQSFVVSTFKGSHSRPAETTLASVYKSEKKKKEKMTNLPVKTALANAMMVQDSARACSD